MQFGHRLLVLIGSGETSPALRGMQAELLQHAPLDQPRVLLETTYGFQVNAEEMTAKLLDWFAVNVGQPLTPTGLYRLDGPDMLLRERGLAMMARAGYVFAGPGSPSFALRQWQDTEIPEQLRRMLREGGVVVFSSAAAVTAGAFSIPVYEIYKAGADASWETGIDLLGDLGIRGAVVPHYDHSEGGDHDTRRCFMGESRMIAMEAMLPEDTVIIGIDEFTALVLDVEADMAHVIGRGGVTIRRGANERRHPAKVHFPLDELRPSGGTRFEQAKSLVAPPPTRLNDLWEIFAASLTSGDSTQAGAVMLEVEELAQRGTSTQGDQDQHRATLRRMIVEITAETRSPLGRQDDGTTDVLMSALLAIRDSARADKQWAIADMIRDRVAEAGIIIRDTPDGATWERAST